MNSEENMMKKITLILIALLLACMTGCGQNAVSTDKPAVNNNGNAASVLAPDPANTDVGKNGAVDAQEPAAALAINTAEAAQKLNQLPAIDAIRYAGGSRIAVLSDKLYLFDLSSNTITAETERNASWHGDFGFYPIADGYVVAATNEAMEMECVFFDEGLKKQDTMNLPQKTGLEPIFATDISISADGNLIAVNDFSKGLNIYHRQTGEVTPVLSLDSPETVAMIGQVAFCSQDQKIVFLGQNLKNGEGESIWGSVENNGSGLHTETGKDLDTMFTSRENVLFGQDLPVDGPSGEACIYVPQTDMFNKISLKEKKESTTLGGSADGQFFASSICNSGHGWTIRVYDTNSGTLLYEQPYNCDTEQYRDPYLYIWDNAGVVMLFFRPLNSDSYKIDFITFAQ